VAGSSSRRVRRGHDAPTVSDRWGRTSEDNPRPSRARNRLHNRQQHGGHEMIPAGKTASVEVWIERCRDGRPTQQARTVPQRMASRYGAKIRRTR
jgi:hypothetical protein